MGTRFLLLCVVVFLSSMGGGVSGCDTNSLANITECTSSVLSSVQRAAQSLDFVKVFEAMCSNNLWNVLLDCVQPLYDSCKKSNNSLFKLIGESVDPDRIRQGYTFICADLDNIKLQSTCIQRQMEDVTRCVRVEAQGLQSEKSWPLDNPEIRKEFICRSQIIGYDCLLRFMGTCGNMITIIENYGRASLPPMCDPYYQWSSSIGVVVAPSVLTVCLVLCLGLLKLF